MEVPGGSDPRDGAGEGAHPDPRAPSAAAPSSGPCAAARDSERQLRLRLCVLNEILGTERDYVGTLRFLQSAFLHRIRQNVADSVEKGLTEENIKILFSNIEDILEVHKDFLAALEYCLHPEPQSQHELGNVFLKFKDKFCVYEEYCSNHEKALRLLVELNKIPTVRAFLLSCMLLGGRKTTDIPLEGYLLSPIQRICKYPLLLKELAKRTPGKHPDHPAVQSALQAMKTVCSNINETKRQMEKLEALEQLQSHIEGWEGSNLTDICTQLLLQGTLLKISAGNIQERAFFLFDNLLVYCKRKSRVTGGKKSTKRTKSINGSLYIFRGRINTEVMEVENVEDGTADYHSHGYTVTNGWKIHNTAKNKWFVCMAKTAEEKQKWLDAIIREREQRESLKLGMERDAYVMIAEKGEKLYHMMMNKKVNLIKDRRRKLSTVPKCFLGNEFVAWLLEIGEISKTEEGVNLGQALLENGIIHHVSDKHQFKNEQVMYRFRYDDGTYKARSELEDIMSKVRGVSWVGTEVTRVTRDRDYHLKTYKSVLPASKLVDWLLAQGDCQTREEAVALGVGLCNNSFMHHVLEKSEFKDESQYFRFHADEEMEGISSKNKQLRNDFKLVENILGKRLLILPQEEDYGFDMEEKNKAVVVKSVQRGSLAELAGLQVGRRIYSINEDLVFLRPFAEVESILNQSFCSRRPLRLLVATKAKEIVKVPDHPEALCFQIRGAAPPYVYAVGRGSEAAAAGLCAGQCILKVNGNNVMNDGAPEVLEHFQAFRNRREEALGLYQWVYHTHEDAQEARASQEAPGEDSSGEGTREEDQPDSAFPLLSLGPQLSLHEDSPVVSLTVDNVHLEHGVVYEYVSTAGVKCHVLEKIVEPRGCFGLTAKILEAFAADDGVFVQNCGRLMALNNNIKTMSHYEFRNICDTKLESISQRIVCYQEAGPSHVTKRPPVALTLATPVEEEFDESFYWLGLSHLNPMSYTQHSITTMAAPSWKCLPAMDGDLQCQGLHDSSFGSANGALGLEDRGLSFLLKQEDREIQDAYLQLFTKLDVALKEMKQYVTQINRLLSTITEPTSGGSCDPPLSEEASSSPLVSEESEMDRTDHGGIKKVCFKVSEEDQEDSGHDTMSYRDSYRWLVDGYGFFLLPGDELPCDMRIPSDKQDKLHGCLEHLFNQVDSIHTLLKGPVMSRAFEETRHFPMDHSLQDGKNQLLLALLKCTENATLGLERQLGRPSLTFSFSDEDPEVQCIRSPVTMLVGRHLRRLHPVFLLQKEERIMLEDIWVTLSELDNVTFSFKQLDENYVANTNVFYHIEGSRQALKVVFYLDGYHFSKLPSRLESGASLRLHTVLFTKSLENAEGPPPPGGQAAEDLQQEINAQSLEKVQQYYRKLRAFYLERSNLPTDASTTVVKIDQLIRPINALDELCRLMKSSVHPKPGAAGSLGAGLIPISSELCYRLGACQIAMCGTGMQRSTLSVSLEQAAILARSHGLLPKCIMQATDIMRKQGPRVEILAKNLRVKDQMPQGAPRLYRLCQPPVDGDL
ncbi:phosphatidylinositol 3,4,5-trisphosphate-dependent Rac exchanger 1 protein [Pteropus vampyrus]|uniref:Phosphatidylinositol 3,4,5-trisphosphate-dependent Rac exchanger 1 protein n=1 Tax=Pteropus vampyrus TaxID=132908 RepID=A0A6P6CSK9_PTEVA|nr:phosphatidylinositol 3,4,5-trisphosphate-dependent Rac exchanger 1 protein [Pteropus vampyrus]